jgi:hypothetical protein
VYDGEQHVRGPGTVAASRMEGLTGRVTARIAPGHLGEVMIAVRGGSEAFHAYAADADETYLPGRRVVVVEYHPPRTVVVAPF